ncbi:MAG: hypothetical protein VX125_12175, partial [Pseudomonadota bacterium]|nr:hypothetical protein [Pseudomonadota bacterium]
MGGSKSQTVGYTYFKGLMAVIGNRIERLLDINPDKKGWILTPEQKQQLKAGRASVFIDQPNLFGGDKKEGGWVGAIDVYVGEDGQPQNTYLAKQIDEDVSSYPNLSYLVFHAQDNLDKGFQLVSMSGMMKEFMLWVKRIHVKNDGSLQWYDPKAEIGYKKGEIKKSKPNSNLNIKNQILVKRKYDGNYVDNVVGEFTTFFSHTGLNFDPPRTPNSGGNSGWEENEVPGPGEYSSETKITIKAFGNYILELNIYLSNYIGNNTSHSVGGRGLLVSEQVDKVVVGIYETAKYKVFIDTSFDVDINNFSSNPVYDEINESYVANSEINIEFVKFHESSEIIDYEHPDINPIHKIREILTDYTAMGKPESEINDENFKFMADRIYDEGLGISWCIQ